MNWTYLDAANQTFTVDDTALVELINNGTVTPETLVWNETMADWIRAGQVWEQLSGVPLPPPLPMAPPPLPVVAPAQPMAGRPGPPVRIAQQSAARRAPPAKAAPKKKGIVFWVAIIATGLTGIMITNGVIMMRNYKPRPKTPAELGFAVAEECIKAKSGKSGGSNAAETEAAQMMAAMSAAFREQTISANASKPKGLFRKAASGMDAKDFVAYCKVKNDTALFLLHVPDLRKFTDEAKEAMLKGAWISAQMALHGMPAPKPKQLTVSTRGILSYDAAYSGKVVDFSVFESTGDAEPTTSQLGIEKTLADPGVMKSDFLKFFETSLLPAGP